MTKNKLRRLLYTTGTIGVLGVLVSTSALDRVVRAAARGDRAIEVGALEKARTHFAEEARPTAATAVVLMTDGENSTSFFRPEQHANAMKAAGTTIWAVGVGTEVSQTELEAIASPDQVIELEEFAELEAAFELIAGQFTPPAATDLVFSASVPAGFTLVAASAATARGTVIESGNTVAWQVDRLGAETITMTYQIRHDDVATPSGGTLTAVTNAVLTLTTPVGGAAFSEAYADVDTRSHGLQCASTTHLLLLGPIEEVRQVREVGQVHEIRQVQQVGQEH